MKNTNLIIGKTNTGKTKGIMFNEVKEIIKNEESFIVLDRREEYFETFGKELKYNDYNTIVINFNDSSKSNGYNPLLLPYKLYKDGKKDVAIDMVKDFAMEICMEDTKGDPFWTNSAADYLTGLTLILFKEGKKEEINLGSLTMLVNQCELKYQDDKTYLNKYLEGIDLLDPIYIALSGTAFAPYETRASILSVLKQKLNAVVMKEEQLNMLCSNEMDLSSLNEKTAIFVIGKNNLSNVVLNQLYYIIKQNSNKFNIIIEDINSYVFNSYMTDIIKDATYNNIKLYITDNDLDSFKSLYKEMPENIIDSNNTKNELIELGSYNEYPVLNKKEYKYFNFRELVK